MSTITPHRHDLSEEHFREAIAGAEHPELLRQLVALSRRTFGFYTRHYQHTINYPWAAALLAALPPGARALEIGAGVNPLPIFLAERGVCVDCVDHSPLIRTLPVGDDWNEWGFFDYGKVSHRLVAHHSDIIEFKPSATYDAIYSVCSISHMLATVREQTFRLCRQWLKPGGSAVIALDLIPSTDFIWNRSGGEVEPPTQHGTINQVLSSLTELGFRIRGSRILRNIPHARTDLLHIVSQNG